MEKKQAEDTKKDNVNMEKLSVSSALVSFEKPTGAGDDHTLSIFPVEVKLSNSDTCVQTYAFLDPRSTASFCTEALRKVLHVKGRKTKILLRTLGQEKVINIDKISGLEIGSTEKNCFMKLPSLYIQDEIPVTKE